MPAELTTFVDIDATPGRVWQVLTDLPAYAEWNPFVTEASGAVVVGERLSVRVPPVNAFVPATLRPTVVEVIDGQVLRWLGRFWVSGLFDADHSFVVKPLGASRTALVQREQFSGLLVPFFRRSLDRGTLPAFEAMNAALKDQAEQATAARG